MRERVEDLLGIHPLPHLGRHLPPLRPRSCCAATASGSACAATSPSSTAATRSAWSRRPSPPRGSPRRPFSPRAVLHQISAAKNRLIEPPAYESAAQNFFEKKVAEPLPALPGAAPAASGVDFDDLISLSGQAAVDRAPTFRERVRARTRYLLVDEYQDTNHAQLRLDPGARRLRRQPHRRGRRGPGDLPLARRRPRQHPGVREDLPRRRRSASWSATTARPRPSSTSPAP